MRRRIDPADLRRHRLLLTSAGRQTASEGLALLSDVFNERLQRASPGRQKELKNLLEHIL